MPDGLPPKAPAPRPRAAKPRAGVQRKTREEREQFAKQEAERQQARTAEASKNASTRGGTRGGRGGRGGKAGAIGAGSGDARSRENPGSGGGVFGAGSGLRSSTRLRSLPEGYSEILEGQSGGRADQADVKPLEADETKNPGGSGGGGAGGSGGRAGAGRNQEIIDIATDDEPDEPKRDIERIYLSSDEDEDAIVAGKRRLKSIHRTSRNGAGLRPVRAPRALREEEEEIAAGRKKVNRTLKKSESEIHDLDDDDAMDVDEPAAATVIKEQPLSSPELRRRNLKKAGSKARELKLATETIEDRAERLRVTEDIHKLQDIFSTERQRHHSTTIDEDEDEDGEPTTLKNGKLFLFQLPPLTPFLHDSSLDSSTEPQVKQEPGTGESIASLPPANQESAIKKETTSVGETTDPNTGTATMRPPALQLDGLLTAAETARLPAGLVGKLRVHKSGKVSLDWGGTDMEVRYGTEVDFLQDAVLVETKKTKKDDADLPQGDDGMGKGKEKEEDTQNDDGDKLDLTAGTTYALGQVRRKMVLIPDWAKLYD